jgi:ATP/maltotriose-dependent transcriptional regulator MalT
LLGTEFLFRGDLERAEPILTEALTAHRRRGDDAEVAILLDQLGILASFQHDLSRAASLLGEALAIQRDLDDEFGIPYSLSSLANQVMLEQGNVIEAATLLSESVKRNNQIGNWTQLAWCFHGLARAAAASGRLEQAARMFGIEATVRTATSAIVPLVEHAAHQRAVSIVRERLTLEAFEAAWSAGEALSREHAVTDALALAAEITTPATATAAPTTDAGLTTRELEVLRLIAAGQTDQQIADTLFVSRRTITTHVSAILGKLGVANRTEAVAYAIRHDLA